MNVHGDILNPRINRLLAAMIAGLLIFASVTELSFFYEAVGNDLPIKVMFSLLGATMLLRLKYFDTLIAALTVLHVLVLGLYNLDDPLSLVTNPIIPSIIIMGIIAGANFRVRHQDTMTLAVLMTFGIILLVQFSQNIDFSPGSTITGRFKGMGSGTIYALTAGFAIIYFVQCYRNGRLGPLALAGLMIVPAWTIYITQSRGVFLSLLIVLILQNMANLKQLSKMLAVAVLVGLIINMNPQIIEHVPLLNRLQFSNSTDLQMYSSERLLTQLTIWNWFSAEQSLTAVLFGAEGLNGVKSLAATQLQFPHFDLLYLLYDGGLWTVVVYVVLAATILRRYENRQYFLLFLLSGLHTNMIIDPTFIVLALILTLEERSLRRFRAASLRNYVA